MIKSERAKIKAALIKAQMVSAVCLLILVSDVQATVFINEVFINPPGSSDDGREFIELLGTPGKKLDGYAIAALDGFDKKLYSPGSIPPAPNPAQEIDELFSLDGLTLGANGILVIGIQSGSAYWYPSLLSDSNYKRWKTLWNGGLDTTGQLGNNGSFTIMLVRNRPGQTKADPIDPNGLRWGKDVPHDAELITPEFDPNDQWGDGYLDEGQSNGLGGYTLDFVGVSTPGDITDDLEIVDEVSFEVGRGWEYDVDTRRTNIGSSSGALSERDVHTLGDSAGFNPDAITRVDYRTKGDGWAPAGGGTGEMANGNNWQDTATEQWIRGESTTGNVPSEGNRLGFFYDNVSNSEPDAVQPYDTHVPLWLDDGNVPDYNFVSAGTYEIAAGRISLHAISFIPGDCDRDGVCDANDISKIANVFGDDDWIFSNGFAAAAEGDSGDPATQTRPWDVDATGDNGIEASDLQWTLNFQGDANGQIVGIMYDSNIPAASGVVLNSNTSVGCTVSTSVNIPSGRTLTTLLVGDVVEVTVSGQVTTGPNTTSGHQNGIMQYVHDVTISSPGVVRVTSLDSLASFATTRASLQALQGTSGDLGMKLVNGYTTSFTEGLVGPVALYHFTLQAIVEGSANLTVSPASAAKFAASTPRGFKVGHTNSNGDPNSSAYPASVSIKVVAAEDLDGDGSIGWDDLAVMCEDWLGTDPNLGFFSSRLGHWKMNDNDANTTVRDSCGNENHGTLSDLGGNPGATTAAHHTDSGNPPYLNGALTFDGVDDYVDIGNVIGTGAYTKVAWVKREAGDLGDNIISGNTGHAFWAPNFGSYLWNHKLSSGHNGSWNIVQDSNTLQTGLWYHVAVTFDPDVDSGKMVLYKNGAPVDTATSVATPSSSATTYIGRFSSGFYFKGGIDNVMVFNKALTAGEIASLYNQGNGTETIPVGQIEGDFNHDGTVDFPDFAEFGSAWEGQ